MDSALEWTKEILKSQTKLKDQDLEEMKLLKELYLMKPSEAVEKGFVSEMIRA